MGLFLVGRAVGDVDAAAIGFPAGDGGCVVVVRILDASIGFLFEFVFGCAGSGIAAEPELFDEMLAFRIGFQALVRGALGVGDDVGGVLVKPQAPKGGLLATDRPLLHLGQDLLACC